MTHELWHMAMTTALADYKQALDAWKADPSETNTRRMNNASAHVDHVEGLRPEITPVEHDTFMGVRLCEATPEQLPDRETVERILDTPSFPVSMPPGARRCSACVEVIENNAGLRLLAQRLLRSTPPAAEPTGDRLRE